VQAGIQCDITFAHGFPLVIQAGDKHITGFAVYPDNLTFLEQGGI
jgi:hypothetical protein